MSTSTLGSGKEYAALTPATSLLSLPPELLSKIAGELSLDDLLQTRAVSRALNKACGTRQVWRQRFASSLGIDIPKPFFLGKSLQECSPRDIEYALRRWDAPWLPANPVRAIQRDVTPGPLDGHRLIGSTAALTPGGRWSLICSDDGSVWYFDLLQDWTSTVSLEPRLLIPALPPPLGVPEHELGSIDRFIDISMDWTSEEALGESPETHSLTQFNIAVLDGWDVPNDPVQFNVWNVKVKDGSHGPELTLGEHLSAFTEDIFFGLKIFCLYGSTLAYARRHGRGVYLVDWREVNGRRMNEPLPGRYIRTGGSNPPYSVVETIQLLPGNRILLFSKSHVDDNALFTLHNWERDITRCETLKSSSVLSTSSRPAIWEFKSPYPTTPFTPQYPLIIRDTIRLVLPTRYMLYGLAVQTDDHTLDGIQLVPLIPGPFAKTTLPTQAFALNRAVGIRIGQRNMFFAQYSWNGKSGEGHDVSALLHVGNPLLHCLPQFDEDLDAIPGSCLFDQFTNRVVITDFETTRFFTIFSTGFTAVGETFSVDRIVASRAEDSDYGSLSDLSDSSSATSEGDKSPEDALDRGEPLVSRRGSPEAASEGESDHGSTKGYSDDEASWKGVGSTGEASGGESDAESDDGEREIGQHLGATGSSYSDDEISWKGVGSAGDCSSEESEGVHELADNERHLDDEEGRESGAGNA